jgi:hypothetical protein
MQGRAAARLARAWGAHGLGLTIALLPFCPISLFPYFPISLFPYFPISLFPYFPIVLLPYSRRGLT